MRNHIVAAILLAASTSLFAQEPAAPAPTDQATIYFYRLRDGYAAILKPSIFCDRKQVARMRNGRFFSEPLTPGQHTITSTFPGSGLVIDAKPGETYYVRLDMTKATFTHAARGSVNQVLESQGKFEVSQLQPAEPEDTKPDGETQSPKTTP